MADGQNFNYSAPIVNECSITKSGTGTLTLSGQNGYTGGTIIDAGTLLVGNSGALGNATNGILVNGGTLNLNGNNISAGAVTLADGTISASSTGFQPVDSPTLTATSYTVSDGTISANLAGSATLAKSTSATVTLSGTDSYTGLTTVYQGTLELSPTAQAPVISGAGADVIGGKIVFDYAAGSDPASAVYQAILANAIYTSSTL